VSLNPRLLATVDGFAVEGGFDRAGGPSTCFAAATHLGQCAPTGDAEGLWEPGGYESLLTAAAGFGVSGVRLTLEWARLEPKVGRVDAGAFERYRAVLDTARALGLWVTGVVVDTAWPAWLGPEAWLQPWVAERVVTHVRRVLDELGDRVDALIVFSQPDALIARGFLHASAPPWRRAAGADATSATGNLRTITERLSEIATLMSRSPGRFVEVPLVSEAAAMSALLAQWSDVDEVHLRSLVRGAGPGASPLGLLARHDGSWQREVPGQIAELWR
jgi:hypothetical protein